MAAKTLLIRADASAEIGVGHVMRCLGLAQAWQASGGRAIFALATGLKELGDRLGSEGSGVVEVRAAPGSEEDAVWTKELGQRYGADWVVLDGFHFTRRYRENLRNGNSRLLLLDDQGDRPPYECDVVLNTNPQASDAMYAHGAGQARFLLGLEYALLRREFLEFRREHSEVPDRARRVLISFGGADPHNVTFRIVEALQGIKNLQLEVTVIVGASNPHYASLQVAVEKSSHLAKLLRNVNNMPELMSQADLAITAGGGTCCELAFMKVPMFLITMAKNHERTVEAYGTANAAFAAGWFDSLETTSWTAPLWNVINDRKLREELRENASRLVDGRGAERVVNTMKSIRIQD
jgi:UDP-2,4-diacetamido-2,4,6-trideoxy-beta-L-altropyranose hydrolase